MFRYEVSNDTVEILGRSGSNTAAEVTIPECIDGYPVISIGASAFANDDSLECVKIPSTICNIKDCAFSACVNLKKVIFYEVTSFPAFRQSIWLYRRCFMDCEKLEEIHTEIPRCFDILTDETRCFCNCKNLKTINLPFAWCIPGYTFHHCAQLNEVTFFQERHSNAVEFSSTAFIGCSCLKDITILGNLSGFNGPKTVKRLKGMHIKCLAGTNVAQWKNEGANIQIISR